MDILEENKALDRIISKRRSVRSFTDVVPVKEHIQQIIEAGRQAPFAGLPNAGTTDFRHFFVISNKHEKIAQLKEMAVLYYRERVPELEKQNNPRMQNLLKACLGQIKDGPRLGSGPWLIIVAERRGFPAREQEALAHCLQNMWLKATALGLGFQLVSVISDMDGSKKLSDLVGLPENEYSYDACMIGYSATPAPTTVREAPHLSLTWFE